MRRAEASACTWSLGHVVLKVRDLQRSEGFYSGVLGMKVISRNSSPRMTFFTFGTPGNHHDFALIEFGPDTTSPDPDTTGLAHVAFKVGSSPEELRLTRRTLDASEIPVLYEAERAFSHSLHVLGPDANEIELYISTLDASVVKG